MKRFRFLACLLAAVMVFSGMGTAAAAYPDVPAGHWSAPYVDDMTQRGVFIGIQEGGQLLFKPNNQMTAVEAVVLCARVSVETALRQQVGDDRTEQIKALTGQEKFWARDEFATCLESGILTDDELKELWQSGDIYRPITKEDFCFYLVRSMHLSGIAENLSSVSLDFTDTDQISEGLENYIYLLTQYGIIGGNDLRQIQPGSTVTREVAATLLSRTMGFIEEKGVSVELSAYTDYAWTAGSIVAAAAGGNDTIALTLQSDVSGLGTFEVPANVTVYESNMKADASALRVGNYARICYGKDGKATAVRLSGSLQRVEGAVADISETSLELSYGDVTRTLALDRFTQVTAGGKAGDRSLIDPDAGYEWASCKVDKLGNVVALELTGGTREVEGLIGSAAPLSGGGTDLTVTCFNGKTQRYTVPAGASMAVNGMTLSSLSGYSGSYVTLRVSNDDGKVKSVSVNTANTYVQGSIRSTGGSVGSRSITITDLSTKKFTAYPVAEGVRITYEGDAMTWNSLQKDWFVTACLTGDEITRLVCYPASRRTEGTITAITYPVGTATQVIAVDTDGGEGLQFEFSLASPPEIDRDGKAAAPDKLRVGDRVAVTERYNSIILIEASSQSASVAGTVTSKSEDQSGVTIGLELSDGGTASYKVGTGVTVTQNGKTMDISAVRVGYQVVLAVSGEEIISIQIVGEEESASLHISGTVIYSDGKSITFRTSGGEIITVTLASGTYIQSVKDGYLSLNDLEPGDALDLYGSYKNGVFVASIAIRT